MKPAKQWADEFLNEHVLNVRGQFMEAFLRRVQADVLEGAALYSAEAMEEKELILGIKKNEK